MDKPVTPGIIFKSTNPKYCFLALSPSQPSLAPRTAEPGPPYCSHPAPDRPASPTGACIKEGRLLEVAPRPPKPTHSRKLWSAQLEEPCRHAGVNWKRVGETTAAIEDARGVRRPVCERRGNIDGREPGVSAARSAAGAGQNQIASGNVRCIDRRRNPQLPGRRIEAANAAGQNPYGSEVARARTGGLEQLKDRTPHQDVSADVAHYKFAGVRHPGQTRNQIVVRRATVEADFNEGSAARRQGEGVVDCEGAD